MYQKEHQTNILDGTLPRLTITGHLVEQQPHAGSRCLRDGSEQTSFHRT
jgi:hypothetical protein